MQPTKQTDCKGYFVGDRFAASAGIELLHCEPGYAKAQVELTGQHHNGAGVTHGGLLFTLADFACAAAVNSHGWVTLSVSASMSYFAKTESGTLIAEAKEIARSKRMCTCDVNVYDQSQKLIANCKVTCFVTEQRIEFLGNVT